MILKASFPGGMKTAYLVLRRAEDYDGVRRNAAWMAHLILWTPYNGRGIGNDGAFFLYYHPGQRSKE